MIKKETKSSKLKKQLNKVKNLLKIEKTSKIKYHQKNIVGEDLPKSSGKKINKVVLFSGLGFSLVILTVLTYFLNFIIQSLEIVSKTEGGILAANINFGFNSELISPVGNPLQYLGLSTVVMAGITILFYMRMNHGSQENIAYGQKGDMKFSSLQEIQNEYPEIPHNKRPFDGIGGLPVSHFKDKYYIDTNTVNSCVLGASRSGKGEMVVVPMIDNLSRAKTKSNMVVNDPKGELFAASKETLEKRGYRVLVLNIDDPLQSMSFNPLQLVIDAWRNEDYHEASKRANTLTSMLFSSGMGTDNEFFYSSAKSAVNAIILTIVEDCFKNNCIEKITMYNVAQMLNELGSIFYTVNNKEVNALDEYFNNLPQGNQAKLEYGSTSFAGDKAKGSILSTASQGISMFTSDLFGKLTSKMSIDLKEIGFPKSIQFKLSEEMTNKRVRINFKRENGKGNYTTFSTYKVKVKALGLCVLNFDETIKPGDLVEILYKDNKEEKPYKCWFKIEFPKENNNSSEAYDTSLILKKLKVSNKFLKLDLNQCVMKYTEQPTAVFMVIPDYDPSNHVIGSIFISQLYTELAVNCKETPNKSCFRRVHFLLDEFGNMPAIDNMDGIMTVCLGRNILFTLFIQSYRQLETRYDKAFHTIKENCQNHVLIMSNDNDTIEEISLKCGHTTALSESVSGKYMDVDNSVSKQSDKERIITPERLSTLIAGEMVVLRNNHRKSVSGEKTRPFPIFNTKQTNMPYRYQFLNDDFNTRNDINDIDIACDHTNLSLLENQIPYASFISDFDTRLKYSLNNNIPISVEDYNQFMQLNENNKEKYDLDKINELSPFKQADQNSDNEEQAVNDLRQQLKNSVVSFKDNAKDLSKRIALEKNNRLTESEHAFFSERLLSDNIFNYFIDLDTENFKEDNLIKQIELVDPIMENISLYNAEREIDQVIAKKIIATHEAYEEVFSVSQKLKEVKEN